MVYKRLSSSLAEDPVLPGLSHFSLLFEKVLSLAVALAVLLFLHSEQADSSDYVILPLAHGSA